MGEGMVFKAEWFRSSCPMYLVAFQLDTVQVGSVLPKDTSALTFVVLHFKVTPLPNSLSAY